MVPSKEYTQFLQRIIKLKAVNETEKKDGVNYFINDIGWTYDLMETL